MPSLPTPGGSTNTWGQELNDYLLVAHNADGTLRATSINTITGLQTALDTKVADTDSPTPINTVWVGSQTLYDAITSKDANTLYFIV